MSTALSFFGYILFVMPIMGMTGTQPHVMVNGKCIAEPGSYRALWCQAPESKPLKWRKKR